MLLFWNLGNPQQTRNYIQLPSEKESVGVCLMRGQMQKKQNEISKIRKLYEEILSRRHIIEGCAKILLRAVMMIEYLERITGKDFMNTKDFREKMDKFMEKFDYKGADLRRARKHMEFERPELAKLFNVSNHSIKQMEQNKKLLSKEAIDLIKSAGYEKLVTLKKVEKNVSESNCMDMPKKDKTPSEKMLEICKVRDLFECDCCKKHKEDYEMTIKTPTPYRTIFICEDCLTKESEDKTSGEKSERQQAA